MYKQWMSRALVIYHKAQVSGKTQFMYSQIFAFCEICVGLIKSYWEKIGPWWRHIWNCCNNHKNGGCKPTHLQRLNTTLRQTNTQQWKSWWSIVAGYVKGNETTHPLTLCPRQPQPLQGGPTAPLATRKVPKVWPRHLGRFGWGSVPSGAASALIWLNFLPLQKRT